MDHWASELDKSLRQHEAHFPLRWQNDLPIVTKQVVGQTGPECRPLASQASIYPRVLLLPPFPPLTSRLIPSTFTSKVVLISKQLWPLYSFGLLVGLWKSEKQVGRKWRAGRRSIIFLWPLVFIPVDPAPRPQSLDFQHFPGLSLKT
jgi:hypothetical protein